MIIICRQDTWCVEKANGVAEFTSGKLVEAMAYMDRVHGVKHYTVQIEDGKIVLRIKS